MHRADTTTAGQRADHEEGQRRGVYHKDTGAAGGGAVSAKVREAAGSTAGKNLGALGNAGKTPMPKQGDYATTGEWQAALAKWRAGENQQKAMRPSPSPAPK